MNRYVMIISAAVLLAGVETTWGSPIESVHYAGNEDDLQQVIDSALPGSTVLCDTNKQLEISTPLTINRHH